MFKNMKIGPKLITSFMIVVIIASVSGIIGATLMSSLDKSYGKALVENGFAQGKIGTFNALLNKGAAVMRDIVMLTDPADIKASQDEFAQVIETTNVAYAAMKENCQTPAELELIAIIDKTLPAYREAREAVVALGLENKNEEALAMFHGEVRPLLLAIVQAGEDLMDLNVELGNTVSADLTKQASTALLIIITIIFASIIISIIFAVFISRSISRPITKVQLAANQLAQGDLHIDITSASKDEVGQMTDSFIDATTMMRAYINDISKTLGEVARGNFTAESTEDFKGDFKAIQVAIDQIIKSLSETLGQISQAADQVSSGSDQVSSGAQELSQGATEQASSVEELAATITDISSQVKITADNARSASEKAQTVGADVTESNHQMGQMIEAIREISESSSEIGKIIKTIEDIAFQTNILALNAAVEAARAGAAGKGFAVVADEVRNLASKSAEASKNTASLIASSVSSVDKGTKIADGTAQALSLAVAGVEEVVQLVEKITDATVEQSTSINQVTTGVDQISAVVQTNSATAEESAAASEELNSQAQMLKSLISQFKLKE